MKRLILIFTILFCGSAQAATMKEIEMESEIRQLQNEVNGTCWDAPCDTLSLDDIRRRLAMLEAYLEIEYATTAPESKNYPQYIKKQKTKKKVSK